MKPLYLTAAGLALLFLLLSIPGREHAVPAAARGSAFSWSQDSLWQVLERTYRDLRPGGCAAADPVARREIRFLTAAAERLSARPLGPDAPLLDSVGGRFFSLGPYVAACPNYSSDYLRLSASLRDAIKWQSRQWDVSLDPVRARLYRSLYGLRAAVVLEVAGAGYTLALPAFTRMKT